jgi:hypothetical protein
VAALLVRMKRERLWVCPASARQRSRRAAILAWRLAARAVWIGRSTGAWLPARLAGGLERVGLASLLERSGSRSWRRPTAQDRSSGCQRAYPPAGNAWSREVVGGGGRWRRRPRPARIRRVLGVNSLSAVGSPKDGLGEDRQHEPLLAQVLPRRPIERVVLSKPLALQPPPSADEPPTRPVSVGATPPHLSTPSDDPLVATGWSDSAPRSITTRCS